MEKPFMNPFYVSLKAVRYEYTAQEVDAKCKLRQERKIDRPSCRNRDASVKKNEKQVEALRKEAPDCSKIEDEAKE